MCTNDCQMCALALIKNLNNVKIMYSKQGDELPSNFKSIKTSCH